MYLKNTLALAIATALSSILTISATPLHDESPALALARELTEKEAQHSFQHVCCSSDCARCTKIVCADTKACELYLPQTDTVCCKKQVGKMGRGLAGYGVTRAGNDD